ncbi:MAG: FHA domain-containing protein [Paraglaciecola sp.]|uniref:FHA domain-containing protein n=1 Tax=Paraglaciecola sp. TaxID=1920173 RepID=UPI003297CDE2
MITVEQHKGNLKMYFPSVAVTENLVLVSGISKPKSSDFFVTQRDTGALIKSDLLIFDDDYNIALLRANGLKAKPVQIVTPPIKRGTILNLVTQQGIQSLVIERALVLNNTQASDENNLSHQLLQEAVTSGVVVDECAGVAGMVIPQRKTIFSSNKKESTRVLYAKDLLDWLGKHNVSDVKTTHCQSVIIEETQIINYQEKVTALNEKLAKVMQENESSNNKIDELEAANTLAKDVFKKEMQELDDALKQSQQESLAALEAQRLKMEAMLERERDKKRLLLSEELDKRKRLEQSSDKNMLYYQIGSVFVLLLILIILVTKRKQSKRIIEEAELASLQLKQRTLSQRHKANAIKELPNVFLECATDSKLIATIKILSSSFIEKPEQAIGRNPEQVEHVINQDTVSRKHIVLFVKDNDYFIQNLKGTNGFNDSLFNGAVMLDKPKKLKHNDRLQLGDVSVKVNFLGSNEGVLIEHTDDSNKLE